MKVPAGITAGKRIRLEKQGGPGIGGSPAGDLYLAIDFEPHPFYRADGRGADIVRAFFVRELPRTFRQNLTYMAVAFAVFAGFAIFGFVATWIDTDFTHFVMLSGITHQITANDQWWLTLNDANQVGASFILSNNILVTMRVFASPSAFASVTVAVGG